MNGLLQLSAALVAGALLGLVFFGGLWTTVSGLDRSTHPALLTLASLLLRFGLALAAFYFLARYAGWQHVLAAVIGFTLPRLFIIRRISLPRPDKEPDA